MKQAPRTQSQDATPTAITCTLARPLERAGVLLAPGQTITVAPWQARWLRAQGVIDHAGDPRDPPDSSDQPDSPDQPKHL